MDEIDDDLEMEPNIMVQLSNSSEFKPPYERIAKNILNDNQLVLNEKVSTAFAFSNLEIYGDDK